MTPEPPPPLCRSAIARAKRPPLSRLLDRIVEELTAGTAMELVVERTERVQRGLRRYEATLAGASCGALDMIGLRMPIGPSFDVIEGPDDKLCQKHYCLQLTLATKHGRPDMVEVAMPNGSIHRRCCGKANLYYYDWGISDGLPPYYIGVMFTGDFYSRRILFKGEADFRKPPYRLRAGLGDTNCHWLEPGPLTLHKILGGVPPSIRYNW